MYRAYFCIYIEHYALCVYMNLPQNLTQRVISDNIILSICKTEISWITMYFLEKF
eukprot:UN25058